MLSADWPVALSGTRPYGRPAQSAVASDEEGIATAKCGPPGQSERPSQRTITTLTTKSANLKGKGRQFFQYVAVWTNHCRRCRDHFRVISPLPLFPPESFSRERKLSWLPQRLDVVFVLPQRCWLKKKQTNKQKSKKYNNQQYKLLESSDNILSTTICLFRIWWNVRILHC